MEHCSKCGSILRIGKTYYTFKNDNNPFKQTEAYTNLERICANKQCGDFNKVVETVTHKIH